MQTEITAPVAAVCDRSSSGGGNWAALSAVCLGALAVVLDTTIVDVALPSIRQSLGFTDTTLIWVVNAYTLTFGGLLVLGGRLGDIYGHRRVFLFGIVLFTCASGACGIAGTKSTFVAARAVQGMGGAIIVPLALSLITSVFRNESERARAVSVYSFVSAAGGTLGLLFGGVLAALYGWHWLFLINVPIGLVVYVLAASYLPRPADGSLNGQLDIWGTIVLIAMSALFVLAAAIGNQSGRTSSSALALTFGAFVALVSFLIIESRVEAPLIPISFFARPNISIACFVRLLWAAGMSAWAYMAVIYISRAFGYGPLGIGLAFLPGNLIMAVMSVGCAAKLVVRFGLRLNIGVGMLLTAVGVALFTGIPQSGAQYTDLLAGMICLGLGVGASFNALLLAATQGVQVNESGLASAITNAASLIGGTVGLTLIQGIAAEGSVAGLEGYRTGFWIAAVCVGCAGAIGSGLLSTSSRRRG